MTVILFIGLVVSNILKYGSKLRVEGFKDKIDEDDDAIKPADDETVKEPTLDSKNKLKGGMKDIDVNDLNQQANALIDAQSKIAANMDKLEPLLAKAETFIEKYTSATEKMQNKGGIK